MDASKISIIMSGITSGLVIVVPLIKTVIDYRYDMKKRRYESEYFYKRSTYTDLMDTLPVLNSKMTLDDCRNVLSKSYKAYAISDNESKQLLKKVINAVKEYTDFGCYRNESEYNFQENLGKDVPFSIVFALTESLHADLVNTRLFRRHNERNVHDVKHTNGND